MLIDNYLPEYHFKEFHSTTIKAHSATLYQKMLHSDLSRSALIKFLFWIRGMPKKLYTIEHLNNLGFIKLDEEPGREIVFGMITGSVMFNNCEPGLSNVDFINKKGTSVMKAVINFYVESKDNYPTMISTETRVWCGSAKMKKGFRFYWLFVKPFSQLIRRLMLNQIKKQIMAEEKV